MELDDYFEELSKGSNRHRARRTSNSLTIMPIEERDPARTHFKQIANEAINRAHAVGYDVSIHESSSDGYGLDSVTISFVE